MATSPAATNQLLGALSHGILGALLQNGLHGKQNNSGAAVGPDAESKASESDPELGCEHSLKDYALRYRQLTVPQLGEAVKFLAGDDIQLEPDGLGAQVKNLVAILRGKHSRKQFENSGRKKKHWKRITLSMRASHKERLSALFIKMLGVTAGAKFRKDCSIGFGTLLRQWRARWQKRVLKHRDHKLECKSLHDKFTKDAQQEYKEILAQYPWVDKLVQAAAQAGD